MASQKLHVSSAARYFALCALTLQNTALTVSMKFSYRATARPYSGAVVVLIVEILKFFICCAITSIEGQAQDVQKALSEAMRAPELATPSLMYVAQNNLILISIKHLSQTAYVVAAQGKVITSAVFSALILGHSFSNRKRVALLTLMTGIILVQLPAELSVDLEHQTKETSSAVIGLLAITAANVTSGYAGVILEKLFKTSTKSIWYRNVQLAAFSLPCAFLTVLASGNFQEKSEFLGGIDSVVLLVIVLNAFGGLITAIVMRYASAVLKCFAVSLSICTCAVISTTQGTILPLHACLGIGLVSLSTLMYTTCRQ